MLLQVALPLSDWVITPGAHEGIVDIKTFSLAQEIRADQRMRKTNEQILGGLRSLLAAKGDSARRSSTKVTSRRTSVLSAIALGAFVVLAN
jgi:hypothetical protein